MIRRPRAGVPTGNSSPEQLMQGFSRFITLTAIVNMAIYTPVFIGSVFIATPPEIRALIPWHVAGMVLNGLALVATIRDLYLRPFQNPNSKVTWCLLITSTGGIGWIVYVFRHALRPYDSTATELSVHDGTHGVNG